MNSWPTEITYSSIDHSLDFRTSLETIQARRAATSCGLNIPLGVRRLKWFKVLYMDDEDIQAMDGLPAQFKEMRELLNEFGVNALTMIGDYLFWLWHEILHLIRKELGGSEIDKMPFRVVITTPSNWREKNSSLLHEAVAAAGLLGPRLCGNTTVNYMTECEAAAKAILNLQDVVVDVGETFIICDAGTLFIVSLQKLVNQLSKYK